MSIDVMKLYREFPAGGNSDRGDWLERCLQHIAAEAIKSVRPEAPRRRLLDTDPHCPSCGHNRDTSSVSSIDATQVHGKGFHYCQKCGAEWTEIETAPSSVDACKAIVVECPGVGEMKWCERCSLYFGKDQACPASVPSPLGKQ